MLSTVRWKGPKGSRGVSLVELLIASGLLFLVCALVGQLAVFNMGSYRHREAGIEAFRDVALRLESLGRQLCYCEAILWPARRAESWRAGSMVGNGGEFRFIFRQRAGPQDREARPLVGFHWHPQSGRLYWESFPADFKPQSENVGEPQFRLRRELWEEGLTHFQVATLNWRQYGGRQFLRLSLRSRLWKAPHQQLPGQLQAPGERSGPLLETIIAIEGVDYEG